MDAHRYLLSFAWRVGSQTGTCDMTDFRPTDAEGVNKPLSPEAIEYARGLVAEEVAAIGFDGAAVSVVNVFKYEG